MGNLANACVIAIAMTFFSQTGPKLTKDGSANVLAVMYGFGAFACLVMVLYRYIFLKESEVSWIPFVCPMRYLDLCASRKQQQQSTVVCTLAMVTKYCH